MIAVGAWLLVTHRTLGIMAASRVAISPQRSVGNVFLFGIVYAIGSLSCTLPIFLVVVGSSLSGQGVLFSLAQFIGYALGMGTTIFVVTIGTAVFRQAMAKWVRQLIPYVHRVSALFLVGAGVYLVYYWVLQGGVF
jgi:cytochrome c biogenesis protein CcdA